MKLDLHVHCAERSSCGRSRQHEMIRAAIRHGLDGIALADHNRLAPAAELAELNRQYRPFRVFGAIELSVGTEHLVVLGVQHECLEARGWAYADLHDFVNEQGGYMILAHPFRYHDAIGFDTAGRSPHAVEVNSSNMGRVRPGRAEALAAELGAAEIVSSDAHRDETVGAFFVTLARAVAEDADLVGALRAGAFENGCDPARIERMHLPPVRVMRPL